MKSSLMSALAVSFAFFGSIWVGHAKMSFNFSMIISNDFFFSPETIPLCWLIYMEFFVCLNGNVISGNSRGDNNTNKNAYCLIEN